MKIFVLLLVYSISNTAAQLCDYSVCDECTLNGCHWCNKFNGESFCTDIDNSVAANCASSTGDGADAFISNPPACFGGCATAEVCDECTTIPGCGWCFDSHSCVASRFYNGTKPIDCQDFSASSCDGRIVMDVKPKLDLGEPFSVHVQNPGWSNGNDYVFIVDQTCQDLDPEDCSLLDWAYVRSSNEILNFTAPRVTDTLRIFYFSYEANEVTGSTSTLEVSSTIVLTTKMSYDIGEQLVINVVTSQWHDPNDYIEAYYTPTNDGTSSTIVWDWAYIPEGSPHNITLSGIPSSTTNATVKYFFFNSIEVTSVSGITISSSVTLSIPSGLTEAFNFVPIQYSTSMPIADYDWIGLYAVGSNDHYCDDCYISWAYLFEANQVGFVMLELPPSSYEISNFEARYHSGRSDEVLGSVQFQLNVLEMYGICSSGCDNAGDICTSSSSCNNCGDVESSCIPVQPIKGKVDNREVKVEAGTTSSFNFYFTGPSELAPLHAYCYGTPPGSTIHQVTNGSNITAVFTWTPDEYQTSYYAEVCCVAFASNGLSSDHVCLSVHSVGAACFSYGDPHIATFDSAALNFQAEGDFYFVKSNDHVTSQFSIQTRFLRCSEGSSATCNRGLAFGDNKQSFAVYFDASTNFLRVEIDGKVTNLVDTLSLPEGGMIKKTVEEYVGTTLTIELPNRIKLRVSPLESLYPGLTAIIPGSFQGKVNGLCGNYNQNRTDDYRLSNGTILDEFDTESIYHLIGLTTRVPQSESLFNYSMIPYNVINNPNWDPSFSASFADANMEEIARSLCTSITSDQSAFNACLFDIGITRDFDVAISSALQTIRSCRETSVDTTGCSVNAACPRFCSFRGICEGTTCKCNPGWTGATCEDKVTPDQSTGETASASRIVYQSLFYVISIFILLLHVIA